MALGGMRRNGRRQHTTQKIHPLMIVAICLAATVLLTVVVGNLLKLWIDDDLFSKLTSGYETEAPEGEGDGQPNVRRVNAYLFALGDKIDGAVGKTALSVPINKPDGTMCYHSDLTEYLGLTSEPTVELDETLAEAYAMVPYISGVFYSQALTYESEDLRYAATVREAAILREFLRAGGSEIVIRGLPLDRLTPDEVKNYFDILRASADNFHIGLSLDWDLVRSENGWRIPAVFASLADFCVLDLTGEELDAADTNELGVSASAERLLADSQYYVAQYGLRLLVSEAQSGLISTMEFRQAANFQVTSHAVSETERE